jgi:MFS family permease
MQQHAASGEHASPPCRIFYGWWIVAIGCLQEAVKSGTFNTGFTLYFLPVLTEWHLSRAATSLPFSLAKLEAALAGPLVGYLIDRFDLRVTMALGTVLAGVGFLLLAATQRYATFLLVFLGLLSIGFHMGFNQGSMAAVNYWFRAKRSFAMSLLQTGQALGGVLLFPLVAVAVLTLGWRAAARLSGSAVLLLLPLVGFMQPTPEPMGLLPDGAPPSPPVGRGHSGAPRRPVQRREDWTLREACQTRAFWRVTGFHALRNVPYGGVTVHLVPLLVWKGVEPATAAFFVGLMACSAVVVRPLTGWLGDRWAKPQIAALGVLLGACGLGILLVSPGTRWHLTLFVLCFSCADSINSVTWALVSDLFGRQHFATIRGWMGMLQSLAAMPAAVLMGWVYDQTHSYAAALLPCILLYGLAALVVWPTTPPPPRG